MAKLSHHQRKHAAKIIACFSSLIHAWATGADRDELKAELQGLGVEVTLGERMQFRGPLTSGAEDE